MASYTKDGISKFDKKSEVISYTLTLIDENDKSEVFSYTYKKSYTMICAKDWLNADDKVLIIDDFMANGQAMRGLIDIVKEAGAELVGIGCAIEKGFQDGGDGLRADGYDLKSLAIIDGADENGFVFRKQ